MRIITILIGFAPFVVGCGDSNDGTRETSDGDGAAGSDVSPDTSVDVETGPDSALDTEPTDTATADTRAHMICHGVTDAPVETITVAEPELQEHLDHGDLRGPCTPLTSTLVPDSHTIIDCDGREVAPADPSVETFVFLHDAVDVHLVDCVVRFHRSVLIVGGGEHVIRDNQLRAAGDAVDVYDSDDNLIADNLVRFGAAGVRFDRDADRNIVERNDMAPNGDETLLEPAGGSVVVLDYPHPAVSFERINDELVQVPNRNTHSDDNVIRDNDIVAGDPTGIAVVVRAKGTLVQGNRVRGGVSGIASFGYNDGTPIKVPGTCSLLPERFCGNNNDCDIEGVDVVPNGTCEGEHNAQSDTRVIATHIEDNVITGASESGIVQMLTRNAEVRGNDVSGCAVGLHLTDYSVEAITVTGNVFSSNDTGLKLEKGWGKSWGADVSGNDFVDNAVGILSNMKATVDGNYWGHDSCPGFTAEDARGRGVDCAPYAVSLAGGVPPDADACPVDTSAPVFDEVCAP